MLSRTLAIVPALLLVAANAHAERPTNVDSTRDGGRTLAHQLERGDSQTHTLEATYDSEGLVGFDLARVTATLTMPVAYEVQSTADGAALIATSLRTPNASMQVDGEAQSTSSLAQAFTSARLSRTVAADGTVTDRSGEFVATSSRDANVMGFISDILAAHWVQFPQEEVEIGDSWLQSVPMDMHDPDNSMSALIQVRYTLEGYASTPAGEVAVIDATYTTEIDGQYVDSTERTVRVVGRGHGEGYVLFDVDAGRVNELHIENGVVLTATQTNGHRAINTFRQDATLRARVLSAGTTEATATP